MKTSNLLVMLLWAGPVAAQVEVKLLLPSISFEAPPPLVVVEPGVQVVSDYDQEVFFVDNWYWCRRDGHWFRTRNYRGGWVVVDSWAVPARIVRVPYGHYRHFHGGHRDVPQPSYRVVTPPRPRVPLPPPVPVVAPPRHRVPLPPAPPVAFVPAPRRPSQLSPAPPSLPPVDDRNRGQQSKRKHGKGGRGKD